MAKKKSKVASAISGLFQSTNVQAPVPQTVQIAAPVPDPLRPYTKNTATPQAITGSQNRNGTTSGNATQNLGQVNADGVLSAISGHMNTFGATVNAAGHARIEVTDGSGNVKFAVKLGVAAQGDHDSVSVAPYGVPVLRGDQVNIVSNVNQTAPCNTWIYGYVVVTPYV